MKIPLKYGTSTCVLLAAACMQGPIEWEAPRPMAGMIGATTRLVMDADATPRLVAESESVVIEPPGACAASVTIARGAHDEWYAAWFGARSDGRVVLSTARSTDGGISWSAPVIADSRDRGRRGCSRPAPALTADSLSGYVHAAYFIEPDEGAGVWYTHSLERGRFWHQPIGVLYGANPASASIASTGDTVLVAYEHPGARGTRLGLAISRQAGHTFAERLRVVRAPGRVRHPRIALRDARLALAWTEEPGGGAEGAQIRVQVGRMR